MGRGARLARRLGLKVNCGTTSDEPQYVTWCEWGFQDVLPCRSRGIRTNLHISSSQLSRFVAQAPDSFHAEDRGYRIATGCTGLCTAPTRRGAASMKKNSYTLSRASSVVCMFSSMWTPRFVNRIPCTGKN